MRKHEIVADMRSCLGVKTGFITLTELSAYMNRKDPHSVARYLAGLDAVEGKYYFISDVAERLIERSMAK